SYKNNRFVHPLAGGQAGSRIARRRDLVPGRDDGAEDRAAAHNVELGCVEAADVGAVLCGPCGHWLSPRCGRIPFVRAEAVPTGSEPVHSPGRAVCAASHNVGQPVRSRTTPATVRATPKTSRALRSVLPRIIALPAIVTSG